jgi:hypothetical protein
MTNRKPDDVSTPTGIVAALRELIAALDRRVPHVERVGEIQIARDAATLRREALRRIEELTRASSDPPLYNQDLVEAIMTDDGGPRPRKGPAPDHEAPVAKPTELIE